MGEIAAAGRNADFFLMKQFTDDAALAELCGG